MDKKERQEWLKRVERFRKRTRDPEGILIADKLREWIIGTNPGIAPVTVTGSGYAIGDRVTVTSKDDVTVTKDVTVTRLAALPPMPPDCPKCLKLRRSTAKRVAAWRARQVN